jgi:predicted esterase
VSEFIKNKSRQLTIKIATLLVLCVSISCGCAKSVEDSTIEKEPPVLSAVHKDVSSIIKGYYEAMPLHYSSSTLYPLIVFLHGAGQYGDGNDDLPIVLDEAIPELLRDRAFPPHVKVKERYYSFIVLVPQFTEKPSDSQIIEFVDYACNNYSIDRSRIYLAGLSSGASLVCNAASTYPSFFAAIVPMAGEPNTGDLERESQSLADNRMPIWLFHNDPDQIAPIQNTRNFINLINSHHPVIPPKLTILPSYGLFGHDSWTRPSDPGFREDGMNIYEWMLQYSR